MEYEIRINGLCEAGNLNTYNDGWEDYLRKEIRRCIENGFIHNRIECRGEVIFDMHEFQKVINDLCKVNKFWKPYTDDEKWLGLNKNADGSVIDGRWEYDMGAIAKMKKHIIDGLVEDIFIKIWKLNDGE